MRAPGSRDAHARDAKSARVRFVAATATTGVFSGASIVDARRPRASSLAALDGRATMDAPSTADERPRARRALARAREVASASAPLLALVSAIGVAFVLRAAMSSSERAAGFDGFFRAIDADGDGELTTTELERYLGGQSRASDAREAREAMDSASDADETVSLRELRSAAKRMRSPRDVERWVRHGVELPEHSAAFHEAGYTLLDFPKLLANDGAALRDLGVVRTVQRERLMRSMKRQLLHVGKTPSKPRRVRAKLVGADVQVTWLKPKNEGSSHVHEYEVQSGLGVGGTVLKWSELGSVDGSTFILNVSGLSRAPGVKHRFRIAAWNEFGRSDEVDSNWVETSDAEDAKWVGTLVSIGFAFRFVVMSRSFIIRLVKFVIGLAQFLHARARGDATKSVREFVEPAFRPRQSASPVSSSIITDRRVFTPTKALRMEALHLRQASGGSGDIIQDMEERRQQASVNLHEAEFAVGAGGSDGFSPVHSSLVLRHAFEAASHTVNHDREEALRQRLTRSLSIKSCNEYGCKVSWRTSARVIRHFCGLCQAWYCVTHTRVSPHGNRGSCRPESRCICQFCYNGLSHEQKMELDEDNAYSLQSRTQGAPKSTISRRMLTRLREVRDKKRRVGGTPQNSLYSAAQAK